MVKKETIFSFRVDPETEVLIKNLATQEDRPLAWILRKLIEEALLNRGLKLKTNRSKPKRPKI